MTTASCHCGAVSLEIATAPVQLTQCNCSVCRRYAPLWAYYSPKQVTVTGATATYLWGDRSLAFHHCPTCGCVSHWSPVDPSVDRMGVNARLMPPDAGADVRIRRFDGADTWKYLD